MDRVALHILCRELREDARVLGSAAQRARERICDVHPGHLEACAFEINRAYNVLEKAFERVCMAFENHFDKQGGHFSIGSQSLRARPPVSGGTPISLEPNQQGRPQGSVGPWF